LIALNLGSAALPADAARTLRDMAANSPARLVALQKGGAVAQGRVRIGRDGVFVDERRIAALDEILETTARGSVSQIEGPVVERGSVGASLLGAFVGFSVGVIPALGGASEGVAWLVLAGSIAAGGYLGHYWSRHTTDGLVYRAPSRD
jgi:predicted amidohydrolase